MLGPALLTCLTALFLPPTPAPQDTGTVDAPVYENAAYGVALPRPFPDWVFEPGEGRRTVTVIFHPRGASLDEQLWGALLLTPYPGRAPLRRVAEQRVRVAWRPQLGSSFAVLGSDSLQIAGWPAMHLSMQGAVGRVGLRAEEYVIARHGDLIVLQFRAPGAGPQDSIAAGFRRVLDGLRIREASAAERGAPREVEGPSPRGLPWSPWQVQALDALVHFDTAQLRVDFAVRMDLVNDGPVSADSAVVWLPPAFTLDSVYAAASRQRLRAARGIAAMRLPAPVETQGGAAITVYYHVGPDGAGLPLDQALLAPDGAYFAGGWLPGVQLALDSAGQVVRALRPSLTLHFDVPGTWRAVAPGRMTAAATSLGRRRITWNTEDVVASLPAFALGPYRVVERREAGLGVALWLAPGDTLSDDAARAMVVAVRAAWIFCSRVFGRLPIAAVNVVSTRLPETRGFAGLVLGAGMEPSPDVLIREIARSWWGNSVDAAGPGSWWILEGLPAWAAIAGRGALEGDTVRQRLVRDAEARWRGASGDRPLATLVPDEPGIELLRSKGAAALEAARRAAGEATFREAVLSLALEHRNGWITLGDVLAAVGADAQAVLRPLLY